MARTSASIARHPIHPMLVVLPLGLWVAALAFDVVHAVTGAAVWERLAFWNVLGGLVGALLAAVPGVVDYLALRGRAGRLGTWHMALNLGAVVLFAVNLLLRTPWGRALTGDDASLPLLLSIAGVAVVGVSGWLGGEMVYVERVGVEEAGARAAEEARRRAA